MARRTRQSTTTRPPASASSPAPLVRDFGRPAAAVPITWDVRTVFDFVLSLSGDAGSTEDLPAADRRWLEQARGWLREQVGEDALGPFFHEVPIGLVGLVIDRPEVTTAAQFVRELEAADFPTLFRVMLGEELRAGSAQRDAALRALEGDLDAIEVLAARSAEHHAPEQRDEVLARLRDPAALLDQAKLVLRAWLERFPEVEDRVAAMIRRDVELRSEDRSTLAPADLIERTTNGVRWLSEPGVNRLILAPSYFSRPYNSLFAGEDWRMFCYPIADQALDSGDPLAPPPAVVRLHRALGDETRLRILRLLRDGDRYLTEIAQALELSKPTVKHHLALLRSAGLITVTDEGSYTYYSLRRDRLQQAGDELRSFLLT
jgi:DNA-binding transcriptional ArsR family regulator